MGQEWGQKPQDVLWVQMRSRIRTCSSSIFHHLDTCLTALRRAITKTQSPIICPAYSQLPSVNAVCQYNSSRGIPWVWDPLCLSLHPCPFLFHLCPSPVQVNKSKAKFSATNSLTQLAQTKHSIATGAFCFSASSLA